MESWKNVAGATISEERYVADRISTLFNSSLSHSLSFPLPSTRVVRPPFFPLFSPCVASSPASSPLLVPPRPVLPRVRTRICMHRASHIQTRWRTLCPWYKLQVIAARGEGSPPPRSSRGEREKGRAEVSSRACETANFMIYKRDPL